ncbi:MAG: hypothetical protein ACRDTG_33025 [Pseudonocardiaceae bacterium]
MSRFALGPRWLLHLPPSVSPCGTSTHPDLTAPPAYLQTLFGQALRPSR